ncbi:MAG: polymerase sigma-70 factor, subfamily [Mycobacterium sp.]|nr:polymerase sigma-70 factor, subfamily [Mycobacterium sp.]MDT7723411.1 polymerase sigma-70 factor, subfamily [Mycobacterium sp.]
MKHRRCAAFSAAERMNDLDAASMRALYDEYGAALCRYAVRLTGDRARAEDVAQETLLRAWRHPEVFKDSERSVRAWLFTVARNMIIDERRSLRFRYEACELDGSGTPDHAGADEVNAALDRLLIGDALAKLSPQHRAVIPGRRLPCARIACSGSRGCRGCTALAGRGPRLLGRLPAARRPGQDVRGGFEPDVGGAAWPVCAQP